MLKKQLKVMIGLLLLTTGTALFGADLYIAPQGKDDNPGTEAKPFATLEAARDAIRTMDRTAKAKGVTVWIAGGTYALDKSFELDGRDSGTEAGPVVYRAAEGASVSLMGGRKIPTTAFKPVTDPVIVNRLEPSVKGKVLQCDLKAIGITNYGPTSSRVNIQLINGALFLTPLALPELFFNNEALPLSVWPNAGFAKYGKVIDKGSVPMFWKKPDRPGAVEKPDRPGTVEYTGTRPERWTKAESIFVQGYFARDWLDDTLKVGKLDIKQKRITFTTPHMYGMKGNRRYRVLGLLEEIDQPGEWMIEHKTGMLYLYPPVDMAKGEFALSVLETPLIQMTGTAHITIRGLTLEATRGVCVEIAGGTDNVIAGCTLRNNGGAGVVIQPVGYNTIDAGALHQFPEETGDVLKDGRRNGVVGCNLYNIGTTGISMIGGNRKTLDPAGHYAINNDIHHFARRQRTNQPAININGVGHRAAHNFIHDAPHVGLDYSGNDHLIEYNELARLCQETGDVGAIYSGKDWSYRGNVVRYNYFHHIKAPGKSASNAIYLDDTCSSTHILGNVFYKVQKAAFIGGGRDNIVENNIFIDVALAVHLDRRSEGWAKKYQKRGGRHRMYAKLEAVNHDKPPYSTRYPKLANILKENPHKPLGNIVLNNVILRSTFVGGSAYGILQLKQNLVTKEDPGFHNVEKSDFRLKENSEVHKNMKDFKPIPFEKMGLTIDEYRDRLPGRSSKAQ